MTRLMVRQVVAVLAGVATSAVIVVAGYASPAGVTASTVRTGPAIPWAAQYRSELKRPRDRGHLQRLAVGIGAALAWQLADLPRHRDPLPVVSGEPRPGALFGAPLFAGPNVTDAPGGVLGAMIGRWNDFYPPYALDSSGSLVSGVTASDTTQSRSGPCPGN